MDTVYYKKPTIIPGAIASEEVTATLENVCKEVHGADN